MFAKKCETVLNVEGVKCEHCKEKIIKGLKEIKVHASVDLEKKTVLVKFDDKKVKLEDIKKKIKELGYEVK